MKISTIYSLDVETAKALRDRANAIGVSYSALADLLLRGGLASIPEPKLQAWAAGLKNGSQADSTKPSEARALEVLTPEWQEFKLTRALAGQGDAVHWRALQALAARGQAEMKALDHAHVDPRTNRPIVSLWRKVAA